MTVENMRPVEIKEMSKDYDHYIGIAGILLHGLKRIQFSDTRDTGVIALSTYAAPHTS
jgi:hypothetical protein